MKNIPLIGFAQGVLHKIVDKYSARSFQAIINSGAKAIELDLDYKAIGKIRKQKSLLNKFERISIHLPAIIYKNNLETINFLDQIARLYKDLNVKLILLHPDTVVDWIIFEKYDFNWAIENMDKNKRSFREGHDFDNFFKNNKKWKIVLDLNHCYSNDSSMKLADRFIEKYSKKIVEIHLSGYAYLHDPLFKTKQIKIINRAKKLNVPIIIESEFNSFFDLQKELSYITHHLNK